MSILMKCNKFQLKTTDDPKESFLEDLNSRHKIHSEAIS